MGMSVKQIGDKSVIVVDCSNYTSRDLDEIRKTLEDASALVATKPEKSVYIITDVTNLKFNSDISDAFKKYAASNTKYVKKSVIVGLSGLQTIVFSAIKTLTKREFHLESTMDGAIKYFESI